MALPRWYGQPTQREEIDLGNPTISYRTLRCLPVNGYSGGRYFTWVLAEGLAAAGHAVTFWTTARPQFADDFAGLPRHASIRLEISPRFKAPGGAVRPDLRRARPGMERRALLSRTPDGPARPCSGRPAEL